MSDNELVDNGGSIDSPRLPQDVFWRAVFGINDLRVLLRKHPDFGKTGQIEPLWRCLEVLDAAIQQNRVSDFSAWCRKFFLMSDPGEFSRLMEGWGQDAREAMADWEKSQTKRDGTANGSIVRYDAEGTDTERLEVD